MTKFQLYTTIFLIGCLCGTLIAVCAISFNKIEPIKKEIFVQKEDYIVKEDSIVLSIGDIWIEDPTYIEDPFQRSKPMYHGKYKILDIKGDYVLYKEFNCHFDGSPCQDSKEINAFVRYKKKLLYN